MSDAIVWSGYTYDELTNQLDSSRSVADAPQYFVRYPEESRRFRATQPDARLDVPFGDTPDERLDIFPCGIAGAPTWIFFHGGWWRRFSKDDFSFCAAGVVASGINVVVPNYALAPTVTVHEIARQAYAATAWVARHVREWGGDAERITVGGHSVGGQLAGLVAAYDFAKHGLRADLVRGVMSVSGVHDLAPIPHSYSNEWARLRDEDVAPLSPIRNLPARAMPLVAAVGGDETEWFRSETASYARAWEAAGYPARHLVLPGINHYTIVLEFIDAGSALSRAAAELARGQASAV